MAVAEVAFMMIGGQVEFQHVKLIQIESHDIVYSRLSEVQSGPGLGLFLQTWPWPSMLGPEMYWPEGLVQDLTLILFFPINLKKNP